MVMVMVMVMVWITYPWHTDHSCCFTAVLPTHGLGLCLLCTKHGHWTFNDRPQMLNVGTQKFNDRPQKLNVGLQKFNDRPQMLNVGPLTRNLNLGLMDPEPYKLFCPNYGPKYLDLGSWTMDLERWSLDLENQDLGLWTIYHVISDQMSDLTVQENWTFCRVLRVGRALVISWSYPSLVQVEIESFGYTMADLKYAWNDGKTSVKMSPDVSLPQFIVLGHR